jgi:hypothetical protein
MGGRASLIMVMGFIYIFSIYQLNMSKRSLAVMENAFNNYERTVCHSIAQSGMNIAASKLYQNVNWRTPMSNISCQGGTFNISFGAGTDTFEVKCVSSYMGIVDSIKAYFTGSGAFTNYTLYTVSENGQAWTAGDTVWGPLHTNSILNHQNKSSIVFYGKVTAGQNISSPPKNSQTQFIGGYEVGVFLPTVQNLSNLISAAASGGFHYGGADTLKFQFLATGNVIVYSNSTPMYPDPGVPLTTLAPNGAIYSNGPIAILGGTVNTSPAGVTIGSGSNVIFYNTISYADNPQTNPNSDDMIAIVANNNIIFDNSVITNWNMQAILMARNGSFMAVDMNKNGSFNYYGSMYQNSRGNAKMFQSFNKKYKWDTRLANKKPPHYPGMSNLTLIAWWE